MPSVLIIDDSPVIRKQLTEIFENELHFTVLDPVSDGQLGYDAYIKQKPDLVTLDITMPNKDGLETLSDIVHFDPAANVVIISAIKDEKKVVRALRLGAATYMKKPLRPQDQEWRDQFKEDILLVFE